MSAFPFRCALTPRAADPERRDAGDRIAFDRHPGGDLDWLPPDAFGRLYPDLEQAMAIAKQIDTLGDGIAGDRVRVIHAASGRVLWHSVASDLFVDDIPVENVHV